MRLFIIGNGFDFGIHKMKTKYIDFKNYLIKNKHADLLENMYSLYDEDILWKDFENTLGKLKSEYVKKLTAINYQDCLQSDIQEIKKYFFEWFSSIDYTDYKPCKDLFHSTDLFLCFNYTDTLNKLYQIEYNQICYIHGFIAARFFGYDDELVLGHKKMETTNDKVYDNIVKLTEKNTVACLEKNKSFFNKIENNIREVISLGFSYGDVDDLYMQEIISKTNKNTIWYLSTFEYENNYQYLTSKIKSLGFLGKFEMFIV